MANDFSTFVPNYRSGEPSGFLCGHQLVNLPNSICSLSTCCELNGHYSKTNGYQAVIERSSGCYVFCGMVSTFCHPLFDFPLGSLMHSFWGQHSVAALYTLQNFFESEFAFCFEFWPSALDCCVGPANLGVHGFPISCSRLVCSRSPLRKLTQLLFSSQGILGIIPVPI